MRVVGMNHKPIKKVEEPKETTKKEIKEPKITKTKIEKEN